MIKAFPKGHDISGIYNDIGNLLKELKQYVKSTQYLEEALALRVDASGLVKAQVHHSLADLYLNQSQSDLAIYHFEKEQNLLRESSHNYGIALTSLGLGKAYTQTQDYDLARSYLIESLEAANELNNDGIRINAYLAVSDMFEEKKLMAESLNDYQQAFIYYKRYSSIQMEARDTDNRLALEALDITHIKYEQELESSLLLQQANIDRLHIEKMDRHAGFTTSL